MKQAFLTCLLLLFAVKCINAQNTQVFHNADSTTNRTVKLLNSGKESTLYSLSWHRGTDTTINDDNLYYKLNMIDASGNLISNKDLYKNGTIVRDYQSLLALDRSFVIVSINDTTENRQHHINYINNNLNTDSFVIMSLDSLDFMYTYCKQNDTLAILLSESRVLSNKAYIVLADTQGNAFVRKRINYEYYYGQSNQIIILPLCIISDGSGGFISAGWYDSAGTDRKNHLLAVDAFGNIKWQYKEQRIASSYIKGIQLMPDKTILAYGAYGDFMYLAKFNQQGQLLSENFYYPGGFGDAPTGNCNIINVKIIDGYIYAVGSTHGKLNSLNTTTDLGTLLKLTMDGEPLWAKVFGNYYYFNILDQIYQTADNRLLLAGLVVDSTQQPIRGVSWYVSTDTAANQTLPWCQLIKAERYYPFSGVNEAQIDNSAIHIYPNPTDGNLTIENRLQAKLQSVQFYNTSGVLCYTEEINSNTSQIAIKATHLPQGLYYIKINTPQGQVVKKIIKE